MKQSLLIAALFLTSTLSAGAQQPAARPEEPPSAPPPAPGSAGIFKGDDELSAALKKAMANVTGDTGSARIANTTEYRVNIVHRDHAAGAIAHRGWTELHYVIDGSGTMVTGGTIKRAADGSPARATIENGETHRMKKGDVVIVPAGSGHWYKEVSGGITYLEVRFIAPPAK